MSDQVDPRQRAFDALQPLAIAIQNVLNRVDQLRREEIARNSTARAGWTPAQRKTENGYARFCDTIEQLKASLSKLPGVKYMSTPTQEAGNLFLWLVSGFLTLRVKSEPSDLEAEATESLLARAATGSDHTVCLSWRITLDERIANARFTSVHDRDPWAISLIELLAAPSNVERIRPTTASGLKFRSRLDKRAVDPNESSSASPDSSS